MSQRFFSVQIEDFKIRKEIRLPRIKASKSRDLFKYYKSEQVSTNKLNAKKYKTDSNPNPEVIAFKNSSSHYSIASEKHLHQQTNLEGWKTIDEDLL